MPLLAFRVFSRIWWSNTRLESKIKPRCLCESVLIICELSKKYLGYWLDFSPTGAGIPDGLCTPGGILGQKDQSRLLIKFSLTNKLSKSFPYRLILL